MSKKKFSSFTTNDIWVFVPVFCFSFLMLAPNEACSQTDTCKLKIYLSEVGITFDPSILTADTATFQLDDGGYIFVHLYSCKGNLDFSVRDSLGNLTITGRYKDAPVQSYCYTHVYRPSIDINSTGNDNIEELYITREYKPIRDGEWTYFQDDEIITRYYNVIVIEK